MRRTPVVPLLVLERGQGRAVDVVVHDPSATVGDLATALGWPGDALVVEGLPRAGHHALAEAGVAPGVRLERPERTLGSGLPIVRTGGTPESQGAPPAVVVDVVAGPDAGASFPLPPGRHLLGRAAGAAVRLQAGVARVEAVLTVGADGALGLEDLSGSPAPHGPGLLAAGSSLLRGRSPGGSGDGGAPAAERDPARAGAALRADGRVVVHRPPPRPPAAPPGPVEVPVPARLEPRPPHGGVAPLATSAMVACVAALVMRQPLLLLVGVGGAVGAMVPALAGRLRHRRRVRRAVQHDAGAVALLVRSLAEHAAARAEHRWLTTPGLVGALARIHESSPELWCRRSSDADVWEVTIGVGEVRAEPWLVRRRASGPGTEPAAPAEVPPASWAAVEAASVLPGVPVTADLGAGAVLGIAGPREDVLGLARSLILQAAASAGPADLVVAVLSPDPEPGTGAPWAWARWLPHCAGPDGPLVGSASTVSRWADDVLAARVDRHVVLVVDGPAALSSRGEPARVLLDRLAGHVAVVVLAERPDLLPAWCTTVVQLGVRARASITGGITGGLPTRVVAACCTARRAERAARALAPLIDPEAPDTGHTLPERLDLASLVPASLLDGRSLAQAWTAAGADPAPRTVLGVTASGVLDIDLERDGPHVLVAGTTGAGKSELLRSLVAGLALSCPPDAVAFVLVDYKGGSAFDACAGLPHVVGVVTDLDGGLAERALRGLDAELRRRETLLRAAGAADLHEYRQAGTAEPLPRLVVVVDELATLVAELPGFVGALVDTARRGRSLGVHLVLATQRPAGAVSDDVRANTNLRLALRVQDAADSVDVVGHPVAASLPRARPGRVVVRFGDGERVEAQTAAVSLPRRQAEDEPVELLGRSTPRAAAGESPPVRVLDIIVAACRSAAVERGAPAPRRAWLDPLPDALARDDLPPGALGLVDDPDVPEQRPLSWDRRAGHLLCAGAVGSGTTTALAAAVLAAAETSPPERLHLHVVDLGGGSLGALAGLPHAGAVVTAADRERQVRLVRHLAGELARRREGQADPYDVLVAVDDLPSWRASFAIPADLPLLEALDGVLAAGPAVGIVVAASAVRPGAFPPVAVAASGLRLVFRLADPTDAAAGGVRPAVTAALPPGRAVLAADERLVQVGHPGGLAAAVKALRSRVARPPAALRAPRLPELPRLVPLDDLTPLPRRSSVDGRWALPLGLDADTQHPVVLDIHPGDHLLVAGPARSGRSEALRLIAHAARGLDSLLFAWCPRGGPLIREPGVVIVAGPDEIVSRLGEPPDDPGRPVVVLIDDAELADDPTGLVAALLAGSGRGAGVTVVAAGRTDALRGAYGHWTQPLRRRRLGVLLRPESDADGDVFGLLPPRLPHLPPAPGRGLLVAAGEARPIQLALAGSADGLTPPAAARSPRGPGRARRR